MAFRAPYKPLKGFMMPLSALKHGLSARVSAAIRHWGLEGQVLWYLVGSARRLYSGAHVKVVFKGLIRLF